MWYKSWPVLKKRRPCISTGIYGYPNEAAANVAIQTVKKFLLENDEISRVIFCVFLEIDFEIYTELLEEYFPENPENIENSEKSEIPEKSDDPENLEKSDSEEPKNKNANAEL